MCLTAAGLPVALAKLLRLGLAELVLGLSGLGSGGDSRSCRGRGGHSGRSPFGTGVGFVSESAHPWAISDWHTPSHSEAEITQAIGFGFAVLAGNR